MGVCEEGTENVKIREGNSFHVNLAADCWCEPLHGELAALRFALRLGILGQGEPTDGLDAG